MVLVRTSSSSGGGGSSSHGSASDTDESGDDNEDHSKSANEAAFEKQMKAFSKKEAPKRSANSFMLFAMRQRPLLMAERPGLNIKELSKVLGEKWRTISEEVKKKFQSAALEKRAAYALEVKKFKVRRATYEGELRAQLGLNPLKKKGAAETAGKLQGGGATGPIKSRTFQAPAFSADDFEEN